MYGMPSMPADRLDRLLRQPAAGLLLRAPQQRDHRRGLPARRVLGDLLLRPRLVLGREGEALGLDLSARAYERPFRLSTVMAGVTGPSRLRLVPRLDGRPNTYRSTSPNTMSSEPRMAATSASMWPRHMKSIACRWAKPGARILQR